MIRVVSGGVFLSPLKIVDDDFVAVAVAVAADDDDFVVVVVAVAADDDDFVVVAVAVAADDDDVGVFCFK